MIIFIIVIVLAVILGVSAYTDMNISQTANLTSTFGTILLSALLAYLYFQMWSTQEERTSIHQNQKKILDRQTEIQEKQHKLIQTEKESLLDIFQQNLNGDSCSICISNHGGGAVVELYIKTILIDDIESFSSKNNSTQLKRSASKTEGGKVIGPKEQAIKMDCQPQFTVEKNGQEREGSFSEISTHLSNDGVDKIQIRADLVTADEFGNVLEKTLIDDEIDTHRNMDLEEVDAWQENT